MDLRLAMLPFLAACVGQVERGVTSSALPLTSEVPGGLEGCTDVLEVDSWAVSNAEPEFLIGTRRDGTICSDTFATVERRLELLSLDTEQLWSSYLLRLERL